MQESGQNVEVQRTLSAHRGQSLQTIVAEQRPGPHDVVFLPGPAVGPWITGKLPNDYREMIGMRRQAQKAAKEQNEQDCAAAYSLLIL